MTSKNVTQIESNIKPDDAVDDIDSQIAALDRKREALLEERRERRSDYRNRLMAIAAIAKAMGVSARPLIEAAKAGKLIAYRVGGTERGDIVSTMANVETYLAGQPAARPAAPPAKDATVTDIYAATVARARGAR